MSNLIPIVIGVVVALAIFAFMWRQGAFLKLSAYFDETKEELRKCTWPTKSELWQSTQVVFVAIMALGVFTMVVDFVFAWVIKSLVA